MTGEAPGGVSEVGLAYREGRWQQVALEPPTGPRCYTTGRYVQGRVRHGDRVVARWVRDAAALGLDRIDEDRATRALVELGLHAFGPTGEGIVRLELRRGPVWLGTPRALDAEPAIWRAGRPSTVHPGVDRRAPGAKRADLGFLHEARRFLERSGLDEVLLFDAEERLVEGARTNLVVALPGGRLVTPGIGRGGVAGVARQILLEEHPEVEEGDVTATELETALELIAINSVRGARPICEIDGRPVGDGRAGPRAAELSAVLAAAP